MAPTRARLASSPGRDRRWTRLSPSWTGCALPAGVPGTPSRPIAASRHTDGLRDELGDVLLQVLFHARIASEAAGGWNIDDVAAGLVAKLVRRHPHVFADTEVSGSADVEANWDEIKKAEKPTRGVTEGVPTALPALALAAKLQSRGTKSGLWKAPADPGGQALEAAAEAANAPTDENIADLLMAAVTLARSAGIDPEAALRRQAMQLRAELDASNA
jgi:XTP/dITP diphosphohydrolase